MSALGPLQTGLSAQLAGAYAPYAPQVTTLVDKGVDKASGAIGGAIGGLFGKKGKAIGKKIGRDLGRIGRKFLPFQEGGKVRKPPGYKKGGKIRKNKK
jgi:hypothetical protein